MTTTFRPIIFNGHSFITFGNKNFILYNTVPLPNSHTNAVIHTAENEKHPIKIVSPKTNISLEFKYWGTFDYDSLHEIANVKHIKLVYAEPKKIYTFVHEGQNGNRYVAYFILGS